MTTTKTIFAYLKDPAEPGRVVTLARKLENGVIHLGYSVCSPKDQHTKARGRLIAEGRMKVRPSTAVVQEGVHPYVTSLRRLVSQETPRVARAIFAYHLKRGYKHSKIFQGAVESSLQA